MNFLVKVNGIYDILCALNILEYIYIPYLGNIHLNMINNNEYNHIFQRYYAYCILTYGYMRLTISDIHFIKMSYFIEAFCIANELHFTNDIHTETALFAIVASVFFGIIV